MSVIIYQLGESGKYLYLQVYLFICICVFVFVFVFVVMVAVQANHAFNAIAARSNRIWSLLVFTREFYTDIYANMSIFQHIVIIQYSRLK